MQSGKYLDRYLTRSLISPLSIYFTSLYLLKLKPQNLLKQLSTSTSNASKEQKGQAHKEIEREEADLPIALGCCVSRMLQWRQTSSRFMQIKSSLTSSIFLADRSATSYLLFHRHIWRYTSAFLPCGSRRISRTYSIEPTLLHTQQQMSEDEVTTLRQRKQTLRKEVRRCIKETYPPNETDDLITQSDLVFSRLFNLPQYQSAKSIGFFLSMPSGEIQTRDAIRKIVDDGKVLYVPRVGLDFEKCDMDLIRAEASPCAVDGMFYDSWPKNKWNIPEPPVDNDASNIAQPGDIDLLLVPGLAFDPNGHRLGQGKGYYDRFISKMREGHSSTDEVKPLLVGVCLEEQYLNKDGFEGIPVTDHDFIMDMVITPTTTLTLQINNGS